MAEEIYSELGATKSIHELDWPKFDENLAKTSAITLIVQINGKLRDKLEVPQGLSNSELEKMALEAPKAKEFIGDKQVVKVIVVPNKLVNIVVK